MSAEECSDLHAFVGTDGAGYPVIISQWRPDAADVAGSYSGKPIYLQVYGQRIPPMCIYTEYPWADKPVVQEFHPTDAAAIPATRWRNKPVEVDAWQYTPEIRAVYAAWPTWMQTAWHLERNIVGALWQQNDAKGSYLMLNTTEGGKVIEIGDYIVRTTAGQLFAIKGKQFESAYEPVK